MGGRTAFDYECSCSPYQKVSRVNNHHRFGTYITDIIWAFACLVLFQKFIACRPKIVEEKKEQMIS